MKKNEPFALIWIILLLVLVAVVVLMPGCDIVSPPPTNPPPTPTIPIIIPHGTPSPTPAPTLDPLDWETHPTTDTWPKEVVITCPNCHPILDRLRKKGFTYDEFKRLQEGGIVTSYKSLQTFYHQNKNHLDERRCEKHLTRRPQLDEFFHK